MADNFVANPGTGGRTFAADDIGGVLTQRVKLTFGANGVASDVASSNPLPTTLPEVNPNTILMRYLSDDGTPGGNKEATGDYSVNPAVFSINPQPNEVYLLHSFTVHIADDGSMDTGKYGNNLNLVNGITLKVKNNQGMSLDLLDGLPVMTNIDWGRPGFFLKFLSFGSGNEYLQAQGTMGGGPLVLDGSIGERVEVGLNDNFSGLTAHSFFVNGGMR